MSIHKLILRTLAHYWRSELGVFAGTAVAALVFAGALGVGHTARQVLLARTQARIGHITHAMVLPDRFFRTELASDLQDRIGGIAAPALVLPGTAGRPDTVARADHIQLIAADARFWALCPAGRPPPEADQGLVLNAALAERLHLSVNEEVILTTDRPGLMPPEMGLAFTPPTPSAMRLTIVAIVDDEHFGAFSLQSVPEKPLLAFLPLQVLQEHLAQPGMVNAILLGPEDHPIPRKDPAPLNLAVRQCWTLKDVGLECYVPPESTSIELRSPRVFLEPAIARTAPALDSNCTAILTYFVHTIRAGTNMIPFSFATALSGYPLTSPLATNAILLSRWAADDLRVVQGQKVTLGYWVLDRNRQLVEQERVFELTDIAEMESPLLDRSFTPAFPGLASVNRCRDWNSDLPLDLDRIRSQDEEYWNRYRETPKAIISLAAGRAAWSNDFGWLTSVRFPQAQWTPATLARSLLARLDPIAFRFQFQPIRDQALATSNKAMDFGQLFLGLSFFLLLAAVILTALLWSLHLTQRMEEIGVLRALGFRPQQIRTVYLVEGMVLTLAGAIAGTLASTIYSQLLFHRLESIWQLTPSVLKSDFAAVLPLDLALLSVGLILAVMLMTQLWTLRVLGHASIRALLASELAAAVASPRPASATPIRRFVVGALLTAAILIILGARGVQAPLLCLTAGASLLLGGIAVCHILLDRWSMPGPKATLSLATLALRNTTRRRLRSLAVIGIMACGIFLLMAVNANRTDPTRHAERRSSGTGGFRWIGESSLPIRENLNAPASRQKLGLNDPAMAPVRFIACRLHAGDDASCRNPHRAQVPAILGVPANELADLGAFSFSATVAGLDQRNGWRILDTQLPEGIIPVAVDATTLEWGLGQKIGAELTVTDDTGRARRLRVIAVIQPSILQGRLLMSSHHFLDLFPSNRGNQFFLIDAPSDDLAPIATLLARPLEDRGLALTRTTDRLRSFMAVESMHLDLFQALGGIGLILGGLGLGILVWRNIVERRGELALLQALGYPPRSIRALLFWEHALQLGSGLIIGTLAGLLAVLPILVEGQGWSALGMVMAMLGLLLGSGLVAIQIGTWGAMHGQPLQALRDE